MNMRRVLCTMLACAAIIGCVSGTAGAVQVTDTTPQKYVMGIGTLWASGAFNVTVPAKSSVYGNTTFSLSAGETVRINASYYPDANVDFGLMAPDGKYHYFSATNGSIDKTIKVDKNGSYTLLIQNNSAKEISVSGYVRY